MSANGDQGSDVEIWLTCGSGGHDARGFSDSDNIEGSGDERSDCGGRERTRNRTCGTGAIDGGAHDGQQIGTKRPVCGQLALFGSDQADNLVTRSNSRNSLAT